MGSRRVVARGAAAVLACALSCIGLTACRTNVGTAGSVNGERISESQVSDLVRPSGPDPSYVAQARQQGQSVSPKTNVLQLLVEEKVFQRSLAADGGIPSAAALTKLHDTAARTLLQTDLTGAKLDAALSRGLQSSGVTKAGVPLFLRVQALEYELIRRSRASSVADLAAAAKKAGVRVSVNPRYGKWNPATLAIKAGGGAPGYLRLQPTPGVAAASSTAPGAN